MISIDDAEVALCPPPPLTSRLYENARALLGDDFHLTGAAHRRRCGRPSILLYYVGLTETAPRRWFHLDPECRVIQTSGRFDW